MNGDDTLARALDSFDVPPMSAGLADRIAAAALADTGLPARAEPRRDRRGLWRRGRQVVIGTLGVGLFSAAAVASGLLGQAGIEVPILSAMLAPTPKPKPAAKHAAVKPKPKTPVSPAPASSPPTRASSPDLPLAPEPMLMPRAEIRAERRAIRQQFAAEHPVAAARIAERVRETLRERAVARRAALVSTEEGGAPRMLTLEQRAALAEANRRDRRRAARLIDRRIEARRLRQATTPEAPAAVAGSDGPQSVALPAEIREVSPAETPALGRWSDMSPADRATRIERVRERRERRARRLRTNPAGGEGNAQVDR